MQKKLLSTCYTPLIDMSRLVWYYPAMKSEPVIRDKCGTYAGFKHHRNHSELLCQPCRDAMNEYRRNHIAKNPDFNARHKATYRSRHPERIKLRSQHTLEANRQRQLIIDTYGIDCYLCNEPIDFDAPGKAPQPGWERSYWVDHLIPVHLGGTSDIGNLRPSHAICNITKGATSA